MSIIVEGPDNSGKSTLVRVISNALLIPISQGEGPVRSRMEFEDRWVRTRYQSNLVFDRHFCVSERIYGPICRGKDFTSHSIEHAFYQQKHLFIYCRGRDLDEHISDHERDTLEHLNSIREHHHLICQSYDDWALEHANVIFRISDSIEKQHRAVERILMLCESFVSIDYGRTGT